MSEKDTPPPVPTKWWQYLFLYPAAALALAGAIPTGLNYVKAFILDVKASRVQIVEEQKVLWERNTDCLLSKPMYEMELPDKAVLGVVICKSGDTLIRYRVPDELNTEKVNFHWVPYPGSETQETRTSRAIDAQTTEVIASVTYGAIKCIKVESTQVVGIVQFLGSEEGVCKLMFIKLETALRTGSYPVLCSQSCGAS